MDADNKPRDALNKLSSQAGAADRDGMQGANRSDSQRYREDLQRGRPPESAAPAARTLVQSIPWWREPWPWILMAGPAAAFAACVVTIVLALDGYGAQRIDDGGRKQGLVVSKEVGKPATTPANPAADTSKGD